MKTQNQDILRNNYGFNLNSKTVETPQTAESISGNITYSSHKEISFSQFISQADKFFLSEDSNFIEYQEFSTRELSYESKGVSSCEKIVQTSQQKQFKNSNAEIILLSSIENKEHKKSFHLKAMKLFKNQRTGLGCFIQNDEIEKHFGDKGLKLVVAEFQNQANIQQENKLNLTLSIKLSKSGFERQVCRFTENRMDKSYSTFYSKSQCLINNNNQQHLFTIIFPYDKILKVKQLQTSLKNKSLLLNEISSIKQLKGIILELCQQNMGSRILQKLIHLSPYQTIKAIQKQISSEYKFLMKDKYGNYIIQKMFYYFEDIDRIKFLQNISDDIVNVARTKFGTHCLQDLVRKCFRSSECVKLIENSIIGYISELSMDEYGTHFVQQIINYSKRKTVYNYFFQNSNLLENSRNKYGILVIKCLMAKACPFSKVNAQKRIFLLNLIYNNFSQIATNEYSHFLFQQLLKYYEFHQLNWILWSIVPNISYYATNQYGSSAICTLLQSYSYTWLNPLAQNIFTSQETVLSLLQSKSGSFLIHKLLSLSDSISQSYMRKTLLSLTSKIVSEERKFKWNRFLKKRFAN